MLLALVFDQLESIINVPWEKSDLFGNIDDNKDWWHAYIKVVDRHVYLKYVDWKLEGILFHQYHCIGFTEHSYKDLQVYSCHWLVICFIMYLIFMGSIHNTTTCIYCFSFLGDGKGLGLELH